MTSPPAIAAQRPLAVLNAFVMAYVILLPYQFVVGREMNFALADGLMMFALLTAMGRLKYRSLVWSGWHYGIIATFALGSLVAVLRFGRLDRYELVNKDAGLMLPFLVYAAITTAVTRWSDVRRILRAFVLTVAAQNIICVGGFLLAYFAGVEDPFARYGGLRLSGMLLDPNAYGGLLVAAFMVCEGASMGVDPLFGKGQLWLFRLSLAMGILFTFSRSAWIALALSLLLLFVLHTGSALRLMLIVVAAVPCVVVLLGSRFLPIFEEMASRPKQVQGRFDLIHAALEQFARHPLLGGGIGNFRLSEGEVAHNTAMWFLADFGIVGLVVLAGFLGWFFVRAWIAYRSAQPRQQPLLLALLLAHTAMFGLSMGIEAFSQRHWWVILALIASSYRLTVLGRKAGPAIVPLPAAAA